MLLIERDDGSLLSSDDGSLRDYFFMNKKIGCVNVIYVYIHFLWCENKRVKKRKG